MQTETRHTPRLLPRNDSNMTLSLGMLGANVFGPQSPLSSLLIQREHLQNEIRRGRDHLENLRKELTVCGAFLQAWPTDEIERGNSWVPGLARQTAANDDMEQFLLEWLERLEARLRAVMREIEELDSRGGLEPFGAEQSMFELLRAAR